MAHRLKTVRDREIGRRLEQLSIDVKVPLSGEDLETARKHVLHSINASTSWDYMVGEIEAELRTIPMFDHLQPELGSKAWYVYQIHVGIQTVRHAIAKKRAEDAACAALRVGHLWTIFEAKEQWPIVAAGNVVNRARRLGGQRKAAKLRRKGVKNLRAFEAFKEKRRRGDKLSDKTAARLYLAENGGDAWQCDTDKERNRKVASFLKRLSTARKNRRR